MYRCSTYEWSSCFNDAVGVLDISLFVMHAMDRQESVRILEF